MAVDVAEMLGAGDKADLGHMGARGFVEVQQDRDRDTGGHAHFDAQAQASSRIVAATAVKSARE